MGRSCSTHGDMRFCILLVGEPEDKKLLGIYMQDERIMLE
jgi:hypothetical protein